MAKHVLAIVDSSGSMDSCRSQVISGFNEYLNDLKRESDGEIRFSLTFFETAVNVIHTGVPVEKVKPLSLETYFPLGCTALYDAIGRSVKALEEKLAGEKDPTILVVIMTDGHENASREFNQNQIRQMITEREGRGNWSFVYLGADQDAWDASAKIGVAAGNTLTYDTARTGQTITTVSASTRSYLKAGKKQTKSFFTPEKER